MPEILHTIEEPVEINLSPQDIAGLFARMNAWEQAMFWQHLKAITDGWEANSVFQWQMMRDEIDKLKRNGKDDAFQAFQDMAQYAE